MARIRRSDPTDVVTLEAVIANDHLVLGGLLVELSRCPETPGVIDDLVSTVEHRERVHMAVVEHVLFPVLTEGHDYAVVEQVVTNHQRIRHDLELLARSDVRHRPDVLDQLEEDMADQFAYEEGVVIPAVEHVPAADAGRLGHQLSQLTAAGLSSSSFDTTDLP